MKKPEPRKGSRRWWLAKTPSERLFDCRHRRIQRAGNNWLWRCLTCKTPFVRAYDVEKQTEAADRVLLSLQRQKDHWRDLAYNEHFGRCQKGPMEEADADAVAE